MLANLYYVTLEHLHQNYLQEWTVDAADSYLNRCIWR